MGVRPEGSGDGKKQPRPALRLYVEACGEGKRVPPKRWGRLLHIFCAQQVGTEIPTRAGPFGPLDHCFPP